MKEPRITRPQQPTGTLFHGPNISYVLELYERYREDAGSVDERTKTFFENWNPSDSDLEVSYPVSAVVVGKVYGAGALVQSVRDFGHLAAQLDPLGSEPPGHPMLEEAFYDLDEGDLEAMPASMVFGPEGQEATSARELIGELRKIYCESTGYDFGHVQDAEERLWLRDAAESERYGAGLDGESAVWMLEHLTRVDALEKFLHKVFPGQKWFGVEGNDMLVPMLDVLIASARDSGISEVTLGTVSRGRLNVLAHVLGKPYVEIFDLFNRQDHRGKQQSVTERPNERWVGDVRHHVGMRGYYRAGGEGNPRVLLNQLSNPSHLEHLNPVVEGVTRASQERRDEAGMPKRNDETALAILAHGDAAFPGEGVAAETLNLSRLPGYTTGGTIHIIINNQVGFTTEPRDGRSTTYASDLAKGYEIPIVHVNADDPEACLAAASIAYAYREKFKKDFMIDLVGYRRHGHNEGDEPNYTQPKMYEVIPSHPSVREIWAKNLEERDLIEPGKADRMAEERFSEMQEIYREGPSENLDEDLVTDNLYTPLVETPETGIPADRLEALNSAMLERPGGFNQNPKLERLLQKSRGDLRILDWAHAEALAFASLLEDGVPIRLTGQDAARGTFSHRHAMLFDAETGDSYVPLQNIPQAEASFAVHNSPLSEIAAMGFEYGYTLRAKESLVLWEAQYGDFANVAQPMIDQFIVSGQAKWGQISSLVLLLPHGYEGQGPEHSSARLERFLQLTAHQNIRVANLTTGAQYFHLLRAQAILQEAQRPLVIMAPKSLLRHPLATSKLEDLTESKFQPVLDDVEARGRTNSVKRLILCSGKIYVELAGSEHREKGVSTAVGRIELLYPFPEEEVRAMVDSYPNLREIFWVQEEPQNMGAWNFVQPLLREIAGDGTPVRYVGKPARPSPAQGSSDFHKREHARIVRTVFEGLDSGKEAAEAAVQGTQARAPDPID